MENRFRNWTFDRIHIFSIGAYIVGVIWRLYYDFVAHRAENYIYSDMNTYHSWAKEILAGKISGIADTVYPPGAAYIYAFLLDADPTYNAMIFAQWFCSSLVPVMLFFLAQEVYRSRFVSYVVLALASLYFPFIYYSSLMLSENFYLFFLVLSLLIFKKAQNTTSAGLGLLSGILFGVTATIKSIGILYGAGFWGLYVITERSWFRVGLTFLAGLALIAGMASQRCTNLNEGKFCLVANDFSRNVLLSHSGETRIILWKDPSRPHAHMFGNPQAAERGYTLQREYDFPVYDNARNIQTAWIWSKENPGAAIVASLRGVLDTMFGWSPWPSMDEFKYRMQIIHIIFLGFIALPALLWIAFRRESWRNSLDEWQLLLPLLIL